MRSNRDVTEAKDIWLLSELLIANCSFGWYISDNYSKNKEMTMACFVVPVAEAVVTTIAEKVIAKKESSSGIKKPFSRKLKWLSNMLWGGSALLAFEHVWHGEVVPWFPFLTAASNPDDAAEMLHEMATVGVTMAVLVTVVWLGMVAASRMIEKRTQNSLPVQG